MFKDHYIKVLISCALISSYGYAGLDPELDQKPTSRSQSPIPTSALENSFSVINDDVSTGLRRSRSAILDEIIKTPTEFVAFNPNDGQAFTYNEVVQIITMYTSLFEETCSYAIEGIGYIFRLQKPPHKKEQIIKFWNCLFERLHIVRDSAKQSYEKNEQLELKQNFKKELDATFDFHRKSIAQINKIFADQILNFPCENCKKSMINTLFSSSISQ